MFGLSYKLGEVSANTKHTVDNVALTLPNLLSFHIIRLGKPKD